ncbi:phage head closure protein [Massilia sp. CCM 8695]|uniref:Phage head closure protein n=1 Tax=Massilia frigida TaxID=2609281 RepID=A0ABX0NGF0_9BURK|nr:phage head closure protein [Massilia frigida]NHZ81832.1 phage head closure protein [Massilia frigida]
MRHLVTIQAPVGRDPIGQPIPGGWVTHATAWADVRMVGGLEAIKAGAVVSQVKASIRMRYRTDLTAAMRVVHGATIYKVLAVLLDEERHQHVDLVCEAIK